MTDTVADAPAESPADEIPDRPRALIEVAVAALAAVVSAGVALWKVGGPSVLGGLWGHWDYTTIYAAAHTAARQLWYTPNYEFGFPFVQDNAHYPSPDYVHLVVLKALALAAGDPLVAANVFLISGFAFVAIAAYALFRVLKFPTWISFALAVSYSLLPWHFDRFVHGFLSNYASVPIGLIIVVAVTSWNLGIAGPSRGRTRDVVIILLLGIYVGLAGTYYAVFISILAAVTIGFQIVVGRRGRDLLPATCLALVPVVVAQAAAYSYKVLAVTPGPIEAAFGRAATDSQTFGGAMFTLLRTTGMWSQNLTVPGLQYLPTVNSALEADARNSTVGLIAVVLSFVVCGIILVQNGRYHRWQGLRQFGYWPWLFMASVLFFVVGGFGQTFSIFFMFQIRSWGRFSIVVILVAYVILGILLIRWIVRSRRRRMVSGIVIAVVLTMTALDVVTSPPPVDAAVATRTADELRDLGAQIDATLPDECGVFELPAYGYPEGVPSDGMPTYEPLLPSLFAEHPRWSYGGIRGTQAGLWSLADVSGNVATLVQQTTAAGFCAILVDTWAYGEDEESPIATLTATLGDPVVTSTSGRWQVFSLDGAGAGTFTRDYILNPVRVSFGFGFGMGIGVGATSAHHQSALIDGGRASLFIENPRDDEVTGSVAFDAQAFGCRGSTALTASTSDSTVGADLPADESVQTVRLPVRVGAGGVTVVHLTVDPMCGSRLDETGVQIVDPRFIPD